MPDTWLQFNSCVPTSQLISKSSNDDGSKTFKYFLTAYVDGNPALIQVNFLNGGNQPPKVVGYYPCDFAKLDFDHLDLASLDRDTGYYFEGSEQVELVTVAWDKGKDEMVYRYYSAIAARALNPDFSSLDSSDCSDVWVKYTFDDVYGNSYYTGYVSVKS